MKLNGGTHRIKCKRMGKATKSRWNILLKAVLCQRLKACRASMPYRLSVCFCSAFCLILFFRFFCFKYFIVWSWFVVATEFVVITSHNLIQDAFVAIVCVRVWANEKNVVFRLCKTCTKYWCVFVFSSS